MKIRSTFAFFAVTVLCACGGGGGGDNGVVRPVAFTSFGDVMPGQVVTAGGISQTENVTQDSSGVVTAIVVNSPDSASTSATLTYGAGSPPALTGLAINAPHSSVQWNDGRGGQTVSCGNQTCSVAGLGASGVAVNAPGSSVAWNYQTFGYWLADTGLPANVAGAISIGNPTPAGGVPVSGTATYTGLSGGLYVNSSGILNEQTAAMSAAVDFGLRTVDFATTGTTVRPWGSSGASTGAPQLDMAGQLTYAAGTNGFTGPVTMGPSGTPTMTGTAVGRFYGPAAQEIGGTYSLTSTSGPVESMIGGFGGKRP